MASGADAARAAAVEATRFARGVCTPNRPSQCRTVV
jgi:hypothetical protein